MFSDKRILNFIVIISLSHLTFLWTFLIFHLDFNFEVVEIVIFVRILASRFIFNDYALSWSKISQKTFLLKSVVYFSAFFIYLIVFYKNIYIYFLLSELFLYLFLINGLMYSYYHYIHRSGSLKTKTLIIYGAGEAGVTLKKEFRKSEYLVKYFVDDNLKLQKQNIDGIPIISPEILKQKHLDNKFDLLTIAMPSIPKKKINQIYETLKDDFKNIQILPPLNEILTDGNFSKQLKNISVEDLLARHPADLDTNRISEFLKGKTVLITGAGGSIGSELVRQAIIFKASKLILVEHSEFNLYKIDDEVNAISNTVIIPVLQSVVNLKMLEKTFAKYKPEIVIHAAAYKHVPLVEENIEEAIINNVLGTKNTIDTAIKFEVEKFILISTDKAVRPTNVMGTTKRICELYSQNAKSNKTDIVAVRFGNVLGSSGSVIPKFKSQIEQGKNITVTHPDITRYFMLIPEACELVLQAGAIGTGGEIFILDMGNPIKIVDLAKKMIELSGEKNIEIEFTGLRAGEKLYEELLIDGTDCNTNYESITVAHPTKYDFQKLNSDISELIQSDNQLEILKNIVPEFNHNQNNKF